LNDADGERLPAGGGSRRTRHQAADALARQGGASTTAITVSWWEPGGFYGYLWFDFGLQDMPSIAGES
jgi:hypothetical protein